MAEYFSREVREGLELARRAASRKRSRLRLQVDGRTVPVLRFWTGGFAVEADGAPALRGLVDLYDGARHLYRCLIVASSEEGGEMTYEFKRNTPAEDRAPLDFVRPDGAPVALLG